MIHDVFYNSKKSEAVPVFPRPSEPTPRGRVREGVLSFSFSSLSFLLHGVYTLRPEGLGGFPRGPTSPHEVWERTYLPMRK